MIRAFAAIRRRIASPAHLPVTVLVPCLALGLLLTSAFPAEAQYGRARDTVIGEEGLPPDLEEVGFDQRLGALVPMDGVFRDEAGRQVTLAQLAGDRPILLAPAYYECPMLCTLVLSGMATTLRAMDLTPGEDFQVVVLGIDPDETPEMAAQAEERTLHRYDRPDAADGFHFLTGDLATIREVTEAVGFRYAYDEARDEWAHAAGLVVLTPEGKAARYFYGVEYPPRDLRLGLVEASDGTIGSAADKVLLYCFRYDPNTGQYSAVVLNILRLAGLITLVVIGLYFLLSRLRNRRRGGGDLETSLGKA